MIAPAFRFFCGSPRRDSPSLDFLSVEKAAAINSLEFICVRLRRKELESLEQILICIEITDQQCGDLGDPFNGNQLPGLRLSDIPCSFHEGVGYQIDVRL